MYISGKYWENYIGDTDDSLTLVEYLSGKGTEELPLAEILADFGLDRLEGGFRRPEEPLAYTSPEGWEMPVSYAIQLVMDLAALLLECRVSGGIDLVELSGEETDGPAVMRITAAPEEHELVNQALADFAAAPMEYDLSEMAPEEDMQELAALCGALREELYGL